VQVAAKTAALLLAGRDQPLAGALQVGGEPDRGDGDPGLPGQVGEQPPVGSGERRLTRSHPEHQRTDGCAVVHQRQRLGRGDRLTGRHRRGVVREPHGHVRQPQPLPHRRDDRRQHRLGRQRALQPLAELGQRGVRLAAPAVEQPVDRPLQARPGGREEHRDDAGRDQRDRQVVLAPQRRAEVADHEHVDADDQHGERAVDQRAVDDDVDAVEPVAEHRDRDRDRQAEQHEDQGDPPDPARQLLGQRQDQQRGRSEEEPLHLLPLGAVRAAEAGDHGGQSQEHPEQERDAEHREQ
jgi:hypothetical protein